jgi:pimeloyl-ACP methyl ester carboxylesterase
MTAPLASPPRAGRITRIAIRIAAGFGLALALAWLATSAYFSTLIAQPSWRRPDPITHAQAVEALRSVARGSVFEATTADDLVLRGLHLPARPANDRFVVMQHGYGGNLLEYQQQYTFWRDLGFDVFLFDQRGSGASDGDFLSAGLLESADLLAVMAQARDAMPSGAKGGVYGRSGGGATAVIYAGQGGNADFLVVDCAYSSFSRQLLDRLGADYGLLPEPLHRPMLATTLLWVRGRFGIDLARAEPLRAAPAIRMPTLFVTTAGDDYVRPEMTQQLYAAVSARKHLRVFASGGHGTAMQAHADAYRDEVRAFLQRYVGMAHRP